ncbi:hypothetical protein B566_EDAN004777 [Ephemera danica]|nr:hypothetical protein B566_EDAN004777 [Ephemera danica]
MEKELEKLYFDPNHVAGFGTAKKLWIATGKKYDRGKILEWLRAQDAHTLHRPRRTRFQRSRYFVPDMNNLFQADLCDMRSLEKFNKGFVYILTVIDVFCKKAWAIPLKDKRASTIIQAFKTIFKTRKPQFLQTDKGKEFVAKDVQKYLKSENIKFYTTKNPDVKASIVERFNRTLKTKMWKYFTHANTYKYVDVLQDLVHAYNNSKHSAINMAPNDVTLKNQSEVYDYLYSGNGRYGKIKKKKIIFNVGDKVRITREKYTFEKGYETNWSTEIFVISKILGGKPPRYEIKDLNEELIDGSFYTEELQRVIVDENTTYKIDKIIASKGKGLSRQVLVKFIQHLDLCKRFKMNQSFYLTLHSDDPSISGLENHTSCFKVHLGDELHLDGQWEVGGSRAINIKRAIPHQLFVSSDLIHNQMVGGTYDKLLRVVNVNHDKYLHGSMGSVKFDRIHYYPVAQHKIDDVEVYIKDRRGKCISFESGTLTVVSPMTDPYTQYYLRQAEGRYGGEYRGTTQKGDGLGSFLGGLFRRVFPLFSSGAKAVGKEALTTGVNLLRDAISGKSMKESVRERVQQAGTNLTNKAARKMESMVGSGYKRRKRKRRSQSRVNVKRRKVVAKRKKRKIVKRKRRDIFG